VKFSDNHRKQYVEATESYGGFCTTCRKFTNSEGIEPDAEGCACDVCQNPTVMGAENALLLGYISFG
jgi:hypothetical protein